MMRSDDYCAVSWFARAGSLAKESCYRLPVLRNMLVLCLVLFSFNLLGCSSSTPVYQQQSTAGLPRSILVLPPVNHSVEVSAPYTFLSTITRPLADRGYYVFPVAMVDRLMRENGMHTAHQMHQIPLDKLYEHTGADTVLYATINDWGQKYQVIQSSTVVSVGLRLVRANDGAVIWQGQARATNNQNSGNGNGLAGLLIGAVVDQVAGSLVDKTYALSRQANNNAIRSLQAGPLLIEYYQTASK